MAQLQPVPRSPSPLAGREGPLVVVVGIALLIAILKPWGSGTGEPMTSPTGSPTASPSVAQASDGHESGLRAELFGPFEPTPEWSIWPAGYFVSVLYVERAPRGEPGTAPESPNVASDESPSTSSGPAPSASSPPGADWPATIDVGVDDHLLWLGINTPRGWTLDRAVLRRTGPDGRLDDVEIRRVATPWPDHFTALALASEGTGRGFRVWPAGNYSLELWASPGDVRRTLEIRIRTAPETGPADDAPASPFYR